MTLAWRLLIVFAVLLMIASALNLGLSLYYGEWWAAVKMSMTLATGAIAYVMGRTRDG